MAKEMGPRERALREQRERRFEENQRATVESLREKVAKIPPTVGAKRKPKAKAVKR